MITKLEYDIGTKNIMSHRVEHGKAFPDTHSKIPLDTSSSIYR